MGWWRNSNRLDRQLDIHNVSQESLKRIRFYLDTQDIQFLFRASSQLQVGITHEFTNCVDRLGSFRYWRDLMGKQYGFVPETMEASGPNPIYVTALPIKED